MIHKPNVGQRVLYKVTGAHGTIDNVRRDGKHTWVWVRWDGTTYRHPTPYACGELLRPKRESGVRNGQSGAVAVAH